VRTTARDASEMLGAGTRVLRVIEAVETLTDPFGHSVFAALFYAEGQKDMDDCIQ